MPPFPARGLKPYYDELQAYLYQAHNADGTLKNSAINAAATTINSRLDKAAVTINAAAFSPASDGVTDARLALQNGLTAAAGGSYTIPRGNYYIVGALVPAANTEITIQPGTTITQGTKYTPVFDCLNVDDVVIHCNNALMRWTGSRAYTFAGGSFRDDDPYVYGAAIWSNGNRCRFYDVRAEGFTCGVYLSGWNGTARINYSKFGNEVHNVTVNTVDFGVLFCGQVDPVIRNVRGSYALQTSSTNPSHILYASNGALNRNVDIDGLFPTGGSGGHAVALKGVDGGRLVGLHTRDCPGLIAIDDINDVTMAMRSVGDTGDAESGSIYCISDADRCRIDAEIHISDASTGVRLARFQGNHSQLHVSGRQRQTTNSSTHDVLVYGNDNTVNYDVVNVANDGTDLMTGRRGVAVISGARAEVTVRRARNVMYAAQVEAAATDPTIVIVDKGFQRASSAAVDAAVAISNTSTTVRGNGIHIASVTGVGQTIRADRTRHQAVHINVTTIDAFTITAPYGSGNVQRGLQMTYVISNTSGGVMGAITWSGFTLGTTWTNPASAQEKSITFVWDGVRWKDIARTA